MIAVVPQPNLDEATLQTYLDAQQEIEAKNIGAHDKAILTLASAALALSLTFSKDLVPFATAQALWVLLLSWLLFVATLVVHILGYVLALSQTRAHQQLGIEVWRHQKRPVSDLEALMRSNSGVMYRFNVLRPLAFLMRHCPAGLRGSRELGVGEVERHGAQSSRRRTPESIQ